MYKITAALKPHTQDNLLDALIAAYDAVDEICTCGADAVQVVAFVEPHMLHTVTRIILRYANEVHVSEQLDEEPQLVPA